MICVSYPTLLITYFANVTKCSPLLQNCIWGILICLWCLCTWVCAQIAGCPEFWGPNPQALQAAEWRLYIQSGSGSCRLGSLHYLIWREMFSIPGKYGLVLHTVFLLKRKVDMCSLLCFKHKGYLISWDLSCDFFRYWIVLEYFSLLLVSITDYFTVWLKRNCDPQSPYPT